MPASRKKALFILVMGRAFLFVISLQGPGLPGLVVEGGRLPAGKWRAAYVRPLHGGKLYAFTSRFSNTTPAITNTTASHPAHASKNGTAFPASISSLRLAFMPCCIRQ